MLWEVEIQPKAADLEKLRISREFELVRGQKDNGVRGQDLLNATSRGFLLEGELQAESIDKLKDLLLIDHLVESGECKELTGKADKEANGTWTVLLKPGVMDPVAQSVLSAAWDLGVEVKTVRTFRRYRLTNRALEMPQERKLLHKILANDAIEHITEGPLSLDHLGLGQPYQFQKITVPIRSLDESSLIKLSQEGQLALNLAEMQSIQQFFQEQGRDPTDVELETLAQTWSEHCSHKTLKGKINFNGRLIDNLLRETIFGATQELRQRWGTRDWCVSVFKDNAGIVRFDDNWNVCFKVETHNHPSAIEPYGGANTGIGGVIRDPLGTGLGAKPICNTDVFCFAPPVLDPGEDLPSGVLHPEMIMNGVVAGVRDYGNRMGIPTVNGTVFFDKRYLGNPLVYCGTVGIIPVDRCEKNPQPGDYIVAVGGRTGRDGIHGATFSSIELTSESEEISGGAVQIGNAITEKKVLDVILQARDLGLYHAITDCGAGGFSSAVGEMGEEIGARVDLDRAPLKYEGLSYTEIWISEAQERMVLAVPPPNWEQLRNLCESEGVEATILGNFEPTGQLRLFYHGEQVGDLAMKFLHDGRPNIVREALWSDPEEVLETSAIVANENYASTLKSILGHYNVCSKEWIVRQYDHEVQGGTVIKPLVGIHEDGPGDAAVITPYLGSPRALAIGCGICPQFGDLDPYQMACLAIDEAVRNVVAVGADPGRIALLDNFCWGNTDRPEVLGSLVRAAEGCRDVALAYGMPFISGKDSLKNEFRSGNLHIVIPPTLLISALGQIPDIHKCITMDLKRAGSSLYLVGGTRREMGGSHYQMIHGLRGGSVPRVDLELAPRIFHFLHRAIQEGRILSCHDLSEGGLAVALAEMAFAGGIGADITSLATVAPGEPDSVVLFSESPTRFVVEVSPVHKSAFEKLLPPDVPCVEIGKTCKETRLRCAGRNGEWIVWAELADLKEAWQKPLRR